MTNALVITAKAPVAGQVKTRLCPPLSAEEAADLFRCFLIDTVERVCTVPNVQVHLAITPADSEPVFRGLLPFPLHYLPQRGDSLGDRLRNIFADLLHSGARHVAIIGSDIPTLPLSYLSQAFALLAEPESDVVLGPSSDGGYYLVGARSVLPALFENITWSTSSVLRETLAQARHHGLQVQLLPPWYDVDTKEDLRKLVAEVGCRDSDHQVPRTRALLARFGFCSA